MSEAIDAIRPNNGPDDRPDHLGHYPGYDPLPPVLMYHSVAPYDHDPYLVTVRPQRFEQQMRWLHRRRLRATSMRELLAARRNGADRGLVGLTFDDGYSDFREHALPVLARFGFTATVFVIADLLGGANSWDQPGPRKTLMTAGEIRHIAASGIEIGSHSRRHVSLTSITTAELTAEVSGSRAILQEVSGQDVSGFCYPYGHIDALAVNAVRAAGYQYGCAIWRSPLTAVHALPRSYIGDRDGSLRLLAKLYRHHLRYRPPTLGQRRR
ncbi:MAG: polysaccharide deacetylase family protein [Pseudonocardiales bacterium]|nr:polysaccharide deacetylase family protein [Pseudonocardiales bacterium]